MKILILANYDVGLYKFRKELLASLLQNYEVHIALPEGEYIKKLIDMGVIFHNVQLKRRGKNIFQEIKLFQVYRKLIYKINPEVVLTYTIKPNIYGGIVCQWMHKPYIANITGLGSAVEKNNIFSNILVFFYRQALKKAECIFFQNHSNKNFFQKCGLKHSNINVIPGSGVNLIEHCYEKYPEKEDEVIFLFVGRLMRDKGVVELLEASKGLKHNGKKVKVWLVGFCEEDFKEELSKIDIPEYVKFWGMQEDVHSFMKKCHVVVLPSYHEGMANVLLEGAACGRPVLASNVPGCKETFDEGISGFGFAAKSVEELQRIMEKFIQLDYQKKIEMGKAGRKKVEKEFDRTIIINRYEKEIRNICKHIKNEKVQ